MAAAPFVASDASAQWPPPKDATAADLAAGKYWPNDPSYGFSETTDGQWNFYSFIPKVAKFVRKEETASGMSIDLAWRYTIGDPNVILAVTDSGIEWDSADIVDKVWLNYKELQNHKPLHADGSACGGDGELAGFDCNGDGILTVSDYAESPNLSPPASDGHPLGDANGNGILDAGDLILNFSDGMDDDGNGYIDDIAGWFFMKDDNDPYDDTRYGHGTGEARDSTAAADNMIDTAGACPKCRFLPLRAGDSFITDSTSFGKAAIYATDNGASIIQCALGTLNMNRFAQAGLDYAYSKGVLSINSMADEDSRHHNMPTASNHTLPVHAIEYDGSWPNPTTFLAFHPCSNYGGQNFLSASGSSCSSEATGKFSGIAGLLFSAARAFNVTPPLTPGEAQSLFFTTADDINVPESRMGDDPLYRWSQPGFDQRFGYGRVNANAAIEALKAGRIPPAVDITSPTWFSVLYKDQVQAPIKIIGSISASRANSYDYEVAWGPGVQPLDSDFKIVKQTTSSIPSSSPTLDELAQLDIRTIDPKHPRDVDSQHGENDTAITVRVRATAHYGGGIGDVNGEMRRTYYVQTDPSLVKGFPMYLGDSGENSPKMADLDGDGVRELIVPTSGGLVHVFKVSADGPKEMKGFPFHALPEDGLLDPPATPETPSYTKAPAYAKGDVDPTIGGEAFGIAPAIGDVDGDGKPEIVLTTYTGSIYVIGTDGKSKPGWPIRLPNVPSCTHDISKKKVSPCMDEDTRIARGAFAAPVLADMNKDGKLDIVVAAFDGNVYAFDGHAKLIKGWPVPVHYTGKLAGDPPQTNRILTTPAVADFNGDGIPEVLVGSNELLGAGQQAGAIYLLDGRGSEAPSLTMPNWPVTMTSFHLFPLVAEGVPNAGVIGTFNGTRAAVMHGNASSPLLLPMDPGRQTMLAATPPNSLPPKHQNPDDPTRTVLGLDPSSSFGKLSTAHVPDTMFPLFAQPSLGDLDQDGTIDVITSGGSLSLAVALQASSGTTGPGQHLLAMWNGKTGAMMPGSPMTLEDFTFFNSQAIVDLNGDDYPEVITGSGGYFLHAFDACGREPDGWPKFTGQWIIPTPAVGDIDGDGKLEVVVGTRDGWLYAWHTEATTDSIIEWESFHHDNYNSGNYDTPLTQGGKHKAKKPLTIDSCQPPVTQTPPDFVANGGCDCGVAGGSDGSERGAFAAFAAALSLVIARTARRRRAPRGPAPRGSRA